MWQYLTSVSTEKVCEMDGLSLDNAITVFTFNTLGNLYLQDYKHV